MRSNDLAEKLGKQFALFGQGKDKKIKHKDLEKIITKLTGLRDELAEAASETKSAKKAERLARHRDDAALLLDRATWLHMQLPQVEQDSDTSDAGEPDAATDSADDPVAVPAAQ